MPTKRDRGPRRRITHGASGVGAAQLQLVGGAQNGGEAERARERLGPVQVRLLELQPGDVGTLITGLRDRPGCSPRQGALLAVQVVVSADGVAHHDLLGKSDEIVTYDVTLSQAFLTKSSKLTNLCYREGPMTDASQRCPSTAWSGASSAPVPR